MITKPGFYLLLSENQLEIQLFCKQFIQKAYPYDKEKSSHVMWTYETKSKDIEEAFYHIKLSYSLKNPCILIIENAYTITSKYAHKFLKTLEDLPDHIYIIFTGSHLNTFLNTIISRSIQIHLSKETLQQSDPLIYSCIHSKHISPCEFDTQLQKETLDPSTCNHKLTQLHKSLLQENPEKYIKIKPFLDKISTKHIIAGTTITLWRSIFATCKMHDS